MCIKDCRLTKIVITEPRKHFSDCEIKFYYYAPYMQTIEKIHELNVRIR